MSKYPNLLVFTAIMAFPALPGRASVIVNLSTSCTYGPQTLTGSSCDTGYPFHVAANGEDMEVFAGNRLQTWISASTVLEMPFTGPFDPSHSAQSTVSLSVHAMTEGVERDGWAAVYIIEGRVFGGETRTATYSYTPPDLLSAVPVFHDLNGHGSPLLYPPTLLPWTLGQPFTLSFLVQNSISDISRGYSAQTLSLDMRFYEGDGRTEVPVVPAPEPSTFFLLLFGSISCMLGRKWRARKSPQRSERTAGTV